VRPRIKMCNGCGTVKVLSDFAKHPQNRSGRQSVCRDCMASDVQKRRHGMTPAEKAAIVEAQGGCALCGTQRPGPKGWVVDHDHTCCGPVRSCEKCRRGVLCLNCNTALGMARDDPELLRRMADYLDSHRASPTLAPGTPTSDSHLRLHTYVRTDGLTENPQDRTHLLALRNAHEKNADFDSIPRSNP